MNISKPPAELPKDFYVYEHRKATTGEVFYVGKGKGGRAWFSVNRKRQWTNVAKKHGVIVRIVQDGLQEWFALELERDLIALHGRMDIGYGPLVNFTDGGEGVSGRLITDQQRELMSLAKRSPEGLERLRAIHLGAKRSDQTKAKMSAAKKGRPCSEVARRARKEAMNRPDVKEKLSAAQAGRATAAQLDATSAKVVICLETGARFRSLRHAAVSMRNEGRSTSAGSIKRSCEIPGRKAGGYTWRYAE